MLKKIFISILFPCTFIPVGLPAIALEGIPKETKACHLQIEASRQRILDIRKLELLETVAEEYPSSEPDRPEQFTHYVAFVLDGSGGDNLMQSPVLMKNISTGVLTSCTSIGSVTFVMNNSGWVETYGKIERMVVEDFRCPDDDTNFPWGTQPCY